MRIKLSEILSTMDQYNGTGEYVDKYDGGEQVNINTSMPFPPNEINIDESLRRILCDMLNEEYVIEDDKIESSDDNSGRYVLSFDRFLMEQNGTHQNVQSYFGCLDDDDDLEEEE